MPRRYRLRPWHGDRWEAFVHNAIERRVFNHLEAIASPLGIDDSTEQKALGDAVTVEMRRAWSYLRDVQAAASEPAARHILRELVRAKDLTAEVERTDPTVRYLIEIHDWPGRGKAFLEEIATDRKRLYKAIARALAAVTKSRRRGHPDHRGQLTEHVLADSLARIFERFGGQATRRFDAYGGFEYGPYRDFVAAVLLIVPDFLKRSPGKRKRQRDPVDYIVRISAKKANRTS